jgi:hypothetical protein
MAKRLDKNDIASLNIVRPYHVSQSIDAFTGTVAYDINVSGSFQVTGSTILSGSTYIKTLTDSAQSNIVTINTATGQLFYTSSNSLNPPLDTNTFFKQEGNSFGTTAILGTNDNNALQFETNSTTKMHITTNGNVGINTTTPYGKFTVIGDGGYLSYNDTDTAGNLLQLSGSSNELTRNNISILSGSSSTVLSQGVRGINELSSPGYGKKGDAFIYASNYINGLNIINYGEGTKEDYIRMYAGNSAEATPDMHIQGSGSTKGYVGINTITPTSQLYVNGTFANGNSLTTTGIYSHAEGHLTTTIGPYSHAEGYQATSSGQYSHAEGYQTIASGNASHAEGYRTISSGSYSHAEGYLTTASGNYSHAEGSYTISNGYGSHTEGYQTTASDDASHAEGYYTTANGASAHAEGSYTIASGHASHAEGNYTIAEGNYSHAEGNQTHAIGIGSHAAGLSTIAMGEYSYAGGYQTIASGSSQTVVGKLNKHGNTLSHFIVGGGINDANRIDAFQVTNNNTIVVATQSSAPSYTGVEGEMVPVINGGNYYIYVYIGGAWRSSSLA